MPRLFQQHCIKKKKKHKLVLVAFVVEHREGNDEEDENGVEDVNREPQILHRESEIARAVVNGMTAGLPVGDVGRQHEDGDGGDGEAQNDDEFGEIRLVGIVRMLVIHQKVDVEEEDDDAHDYGDD